MSLYLLTERVLYAEEKGAAKIESLRYWGMINSEINRRSRKLLCLFYRLLVKNYFEAKNHKPLQNIELETDEKNKNFDYPIFEYRYALQLSDY